MNNWFATSSLMTIHTLTQLIHYFSNSFRNLCILENIIYIFLFHSAALEYSGSQPSHRGLPVHLVCGPSSVVFKEDIRPICTQLRPRGLLFVYCWQIYASKLTHWPMGDLNTIFKLISATGGWGLSCKIALRWMPLDLTDDKSTLVQVMAWCRQATSHYLSQCWPRFMLPYGVTRPKWANLLCTEMFLHKLIMNPFCKGLMSS